MAVAGSTHPMSWLYQGAAKGAAVSIRFFMAAAGLFCLCQRMWFAALLDDSDALLFDLNEPFEPEVPQRLAQV
jgi:hypothetical protein